MNNQCLTVADPWNSVRYIDKVADYLDEVTGNQTTVRLIWDEPGSGMGFVDFERFCAEFAKRFHVMACPIDSWYFKDLDVKEYENRVRLCCGISEVEYVEIGNEIGGDWLGDISEVLAKLESGLFAMRESKKDVVITWFLDSAEEDPVDTLRSYRKLLLILTEDSFENAYELVSFYPNWNPDAVEPDWNALAECFDGIGEYGPQPQELGVGELKRLVHRYEMEILPLMGCGGFYWNASRDVFSEAAPLLKYFGGLWSKDRSQGEESGADKVLTVEDVRKATSSAFIDVIGHVPQDFVGQLAPAIHRNLPLPWGG